MFVQFAVKGIIYTKTVHQIATHKLFSLMIPKRYSQKSKFVINFITSPANYKDVRLLKLEILMIKAPKFQNKNKFKTSILDILFEALFLSLIWW